MRRTIGSIVAALGVGLLTCLVPACGGGDEDGGGGGGGAGGSCTDYNGTVECLEYSGGDWDPASAQIHCQGMQGTHVSTDCPTEGALGRCTITAGDPMQYWHVYYDASRLAEAESACALNSGVWESL